MPISERLRERLREIREDKNLSQKDIQKRSGLLRHYISRVEDGRTVPGIETLEKMARALEVPMYQLFYEGEEPPKTPLVKRKTADEIALGGSRKEAKFLLKFRKLLARMNKDDQHLLFYVAKTMVHPGREPAAEPSQAAQKRLISLYHPLVDKQIEGRASPKELAKLRSIEGLLQAIEDAQTHRIDKVLEQRHRAIIEGLKTLTLELRTMAAASERPPITAP